uniref:AAA+ ATPase domain-containing protein n=1 Tax=Lutzomyia longipalpis TaxID=7200 RepID=A0A1B0EXW2_LUTLO
MKIKLPQKLRKNKRHIEDVPFYAFKYEEGDLPLDPARPFIQEQIDKLKKAKPIEFRRDFDLFYHNTKRSDLKPNEEVTQYLLSLLKKKPLKLTGPKVKRLSALEINKRLRRKFSYPVDAVTPYKTISLDKFHLSFDRDKIKPRRIKDFPRDAIKSPEEYRRELEKVNRVINELLQPEIRRYEETQRQIRDGSFFKYQRSASTSTSTSKPATKKRKLSNEQYLKKVKAAEREKLKYFRPIMPMEVEDQRSRILRHHTAHMKVEFAKFTADIQTRSIDVMAQINVLRVQDYPSHLIVKILPKINPRVGFLKDAYKFIQAEKLLWPNIHPEVMLMDFLFNPDRQIRPETATMIMSLLMDLEEDYRNAIRRYVLQKVLQKKENQEDLDLVPEPRDFPRLTIQAPVPWKCAIQVARNRLDQVLMITHPVLQAINMLWHELYSDLLIVDTSKMYKTDIPLDSGSMGDLVHSCCVIARDILVNDWLPRVADLIDEMRKFWIDLVAFHSRHGGRATIMFRAIHALMSYQLQKLIKKSVDHLMETIQTYSGGNVEDSGVKLTRQPLMTLNVSVVGKYSGELDQNTNEESILYNVEIDDPHILDTSPEQPATPTLTTVSFIIRHSGKIFVDPYMEELPDIFVNYFVKILKVGYNIPRMEYFMSQTSSEMGFLHCIPEDHIDMLQLYERVREIVIANQTGPTTYLYPIYTYYFPILAGKMQAITENLFLQPNIPSLPAFRNLMEKFNELLFGVYYLRDFVPLNLFMLDNRRVNEVLARMIKDMKDFVTDYFRTKNQVENRKLCDEFEEISLHAGGRPKETPEVVALQNYLNQCRDERLFVLKSEIKLVAERVMFLLHYATLDADDIHLNSRTFLWPSELEQVLDLSAARLSVVRDNLEYALRERKVQFDGYLLTEKKKMDAFRMKEIRDVLTLDELKEKVDTVDGLMSILQKCNEEATAINVDENLLQIEQSSFPVLVELMEKMDPIEKLWHTAYQFDSCYEGWYYGPFQNLDAEKIREEVESMGKVIYKLSKALVTNPQAKRIAEQVRMKIDKFKIYLPVLEAICRQGLSERHWNLISEELGQEVTPDKYSTLASLVEIDIMRIVDRLEQISNAAGKEFELNNQLLQMQSEWTDVEFEINPYRDSDTHILASVDDIQTLLDDHILKAQAMRGSPYIAALGEKATNWEDKLISMQDILDIWLKVQSTWMYLEPIFNSEDIMRQMPQEGRNFKAVDRILRKIMKHTEAERRVIQATDYPKMLEILQKAFVDLEGIQKGLNMYLEKKRQYFSRFYFLSNDELLEILSETKDPLRVQPHLKKCFDGIHSLQFDQSMEIMAMISIEGEIVPLTKRINPASANGLVEKWLKEVQQVMFESIEEQLRSAYDIYYVTPRKTWCMKWAGQIVHTISCLTWTSDVEEAITKGTLSTYYEASGKQLEENVKLIRGGTLTDSQRITMESLVVLDVHKKDVVKKLIESRVSEIGDFEWFSQLHDIILFEDICKDLFPNVKLPTRDREDVNKWLEVKAKERNIQLTPWFKETILQIYETLLVRHGLVVVGEPMAGKTTAYQLLASALREIQRDPDAKNPEFGVNSRIINPKAISMGQLYGHFDPISHEWVDGVLAKTFRDMAYSSVNERQWIIFDGPVDPIWIENLNTVLDDNRKLCLMSGEIIYMSRQMNLIFEPDNLDQASPATVSRCGMIYMESCQLGWDSLHNSFIRELQEKGTTDIYVSLYDALVTWLIPPLLEILSTCETILSVSSFYRYRMLSTFFMAFLSKQTNLNQTWYQQTFLYCLVWSYCSTLTPESRKVVDSALRKILYGTNDNYPKPKLFTLNRGQIFPEKMTFLDYRFDGTESWWPWAKSEDSALVSDLPLSEIIVPTKESGYIQNWLELCVEIRLPILLVGPSGTGKSAIVNAFMRELPKNKFLINNINLSARTTAQQVQELVMAKLDRRRKGVFGPPVGKQCLVFVDDMAMPMRDKYGSQPALELIRQWLDHKHWSDFEDTSKLELIDLLCIGAMGLVGGSNYIFERLYRHMFIVSVDALEVPTMQRIFHALGEWHFSKDYPETLTRLSKALSVAAIELFSVVRETFLPTPAKSHYMFSLQDVSKVYQGMVLVPAKRLQDPEKLIRLWAHETYRIFYDRLIDEDDRNRLFNILHTTCTSKLRMSLSQALGERISATERLSDSHMRDLIYGNYMEPDADTQNLR